MKQWIKRLVCLALAAACMGVHMGMAEQMYFGAQAGEAWYREMLAAGQLALGNNARLKRVIARAQVGETITVATIGGSITEGAGAAAYPECWASRFAEGFRARFGAGDGSNVKFVNAGVGGTPSTFGLMRYQRDIVDRVRDDDGLPDLVIVEFAVNDGGEPTGHRCYESLVKTILSQPNDPAVILLFSVFWGGWNLQNELIRVGRTYDLMMVSVKDACYPHVGAEWTKEAFFHDDYHPTSMGHAAMADCILAAVDAAAARETDPADADPDVKPAYGTDFVGLQTLYADTIYRGLGLQRGGFMRDDAGSYRNLPVGRVCGANFHHQPGDSADPLRFTASFRNLLIAWRTVADARYGRAEVRVDGRTVRVLDGYGADKWGQSEVALCFDAKEAAEHTVEIVMAEDSADKYFTVTCIGYTP